MFSLLRPAPVAPPLPAERVDPEYRRLRWQVFTGNSATLESTGEPFPVDD